jgi:tetratricopeptide (TPR) repeat protein
MRLCCALTVLCAGLAVANAETPQQEADRLFAEGRELLTVENDAAAACEKFEAAIKLDPTGPGTMLNLGLCYELMGKYATSIRWFRKAQTAAAESQLVEYENAAKDHTSIIAPKVPTLKLEVTGPPEVAISIDGFSIPATEYGRVEVDPGRHVIEGRAPGMQPTRVEIEIAEAENQVVAIAVTEPVLVLVDMGKTRRRIALGVAGAGAVTLGASLVYNLMKRNEQRDALEPYDMERFERAENDMRTVGTGLFVAGSVLVVAGAVLYFTAPGLEHVRPTTAVAPVVGTDRVGFAVSGAF